MSAPFLSIILPVLNEAPLIGTFLLHLRAVAPAAEIIVVDGGSRDGTARIAEQLADLVISAQTGRASQMNAGAAVARGDMLWFLHADLQVPRDSLRQIEDVLADRRVVGGCFRLRFPQRQRIYRISDSVGNVAVEVFGFALGDHGIFCRREVFNQLRGYRDVPILEDAEIYRALRGRGRMVQLRDEILCSPRAYLKHGPYRTTAVYFLILALYVAGVPIRRLNRIYRWFRGSAVGILQRSSEDTTATGPKANRWVARASRALVAASRRNKLSEKFVSAGDTETSTRDACATQILKSRVRPCERVTNAGAG